MKTSIQINYSSPTMGSMTRCATLATMVPAIHELEALGFTIGCVAHYKYGRGPKAKLLEIFYFNDTKSYFGPFAN